MSPIDDCAESCSEGCGCPEGKVQLDGVCVTTSTCSGVLNNAYICFVFQYDVLQDAVNVLKIRYVLQSYLETLKQLFVRTLHQVLFTHHLIHLLCIILHAWQINYHNMTNIWSTTNNCAYYYSIHSSVFF